MKIEWWMIDGGVALILLVAAIRGAAKGIGDTVLRILGFIGSLVFAVLFSKKVSEFLAGTSIKETLYNHIYDLINPGTEEAASQAVASQSEAVTSVVGHGSDVYGSILPKSLTGMLSDFEGTVIDEAAEHLTSIALSVLAFVLIMLVVWFVITILRLAFKSGKKNSFVLGFLDRVLGFVLGVVRGGLIACVAVAALIPITTLVAPDRVAEMLEALQNTYVAGIIYDVNPIMFIINLFLL